MFLLLSFVLVLLPFVSVPKKGSILFREFKFNYEASFSIKKMFSMFVSFLKVFDYMLKNNFGVQFVWTSGFVSWILSCVFWVQEVNFLSSTFVFISILLCLVSIFGVSDFSLEEVPNWSEAKVGFSAYFVVISFSVLVMLVTKNVGDGVTTLFVLLISLYIERQHQKTK